MKIKFNRLVCVHVSYLCMTIIASNTHNIYEDDYITALDKLGHASNSKLTDC